MVKKYVKRDESLVGNIKGLLKDNVAVKVILSKKKYTVIAINQDTVLLQSGDSKVSCRLNLVLAKASFFTEVVPNGKNQKENLAYNVFGFGSLLGVIYANNIEDAFEKAIHTYGKRNITDVRRRYYRSIRF